MELASSYWFFKSVFFLLREREREKRGLGKREGWGREESSLLSDLILKVRNRKEEENKERKEES